MEKELFKWAKETKLTKISDLENNPEKINEIDIADLDSFIALAEKEMAWNEEKIAKLQAIIESNSNLA